MSKIEAVKTLFEIGKLAAETYDTYIEGFRKAKDTSKDREIEDLGREVEKLKEENEDLKEQLKEQSK